MKKINIHKDNESYHKNSLNEGKFIFVYFLENLKLKKRLEESEREVDENKQIILELDSVKSDSNRLIREIKVLKKEIEIMKENQEVDSQKCLHKVKLKGKINKVNIRQTNTRIDRFNWEISE